MADWQIIDSDTFPEETGQNPASKQPAPRRRWGVWLVGLILFLVTAGFFGLRGQRIENQTQLHDDLTAYIFEEETLRYLGHADQIEIVTNAPVSWQKAYQQTFDPDPEKSPPGAISLSELEFDGQCADVTVEWQATQHRQARTYCLSQRGWRRAPFSGAARSDARTVIKVNDDLEVRFFPGDQAFAETLAQELSAFQANLARLTTITPKSRPLVVIVVPLEFRPPHVRTRYSRVIVNSPRLIPPHATESLSGQDAVRLAAGRAMLNWFDPLPAESDSSLPGSTRFLNAIHEIMAMHHLLPPEARAALVDHWREQLGGRWASPFFAELIAVDGDEFNRRADLAARLTAHYIYQQEGLEKLVSMRPAFSTASTWDDLLRTTLNRTTLALERDVAEYSRAAANLHLEPTTSFEAVFQRIEPESSANRLFYVKLPGQAEEIPVRMPPDTVFRAPDGRPLFPGCTPEGTLLQIEGGRLEPEAGLQAAQVIAPTSPSLAAPLPLEPAPPDTIAFLLTGQWRAPTGLVALAADGSLHQISPLSSTLRVHPLSNASGNQPHFLFKLDLATCPGSWFIHYIPAQGVAGQWLAPPNLRHWVWRADRQDLIFLSEQGEAIHNLYQTTDTFSPVFVGRSTVPRGLLGWNVPHQRLVTSASWPHGYYAGFFDLKLGVTSVVRYDQALRGRALSPDGQWLAFLDSDEGLGTPPEHLKITDLEHQATRTALHVGPNESIWLSTWSPNVAEPRLAVLTGPTVDEQAWPRQTNLLVLSPDQPDDPVLVTQAQPEERLSSPVFCLDGSLLYLVVENGRYRLVQQTPGDAARQLAAFDQLLRPISC